MTAVLAHKAKDRSAATWRAVLAPFERLTWVVSDAAKGISSAIAQINTERSKAEPTAPRITHGLDLFHTARAAGRILARLWRQAESAWQKAEQATAAIAEAQRHGLDARGPARRARAAWDKATAAFGQADDQQTAWDQARAAFALCDDRGRLQDRPRAEAQIAEAVARLSGSAWDKVRRLLTDPRSLTFLDRMHDRLEVAEPDPARRATWAWRWWLRAGRARRPTDPVTAAVHHHGRHSRLPAEDQAGYDRVAAVLATTVRASSAVECLNSVLRMQQSRHKRLTQPLLDLKRLYWNSRPLRSGPRKAQSPYQALGLPLPTFAFWELLHTDPATLTQQLSSQGDSG